MKIKSWCSALLALFCLAACKHLGTKPEFHEPALRTNSGLAYAPSYLIGTEKASRKTIGGPRWEDCAGSPYCFRIDAPGLTPELQAKIEHRLDDSKGHFVSHILRYDRPAGEPAIRKSILYSIYADDGADKSANCVSGKDKGRQACYNSGWDALRHLRQDMASTIQAHRITHILVMSTGWNTPQEQSLRDYSEWMANIMAAALEDGQKEFRPLFIGLSWMSDWPSWIWAGFGDALNKAHDADDVGLTLANILLHEVVLPLKRDYGQPVVLIGHSFGARILTRAIHSQAILPSAQPEERVDLMVGLQAAFSVNRFTADRGNEAQPYREFAKRAGKFILTSSKHDTAVPLAIYTGDRFAGSANVYALTQTPAYSALFEHIALDDRGRWDRPPSLDPARVTMVEASAMVATNRPGTGGGAHSDVYDKEAGWFLWQAIKRFAPPR